MLHHSDNKSNNNMNKINSANSFGKRVLENFNHHLRNSKLCIILRSFMFHSNLFWIQLSYFVFISLVGYLALSLLSKTSRRVVPKDLDLFFTSVSATTVSSMSTVEIEVFSNSQLIILTILMLFGGEVFTSMIGIQIEKYKFSKPQTFVAVDRIANTTCSQLDQLEQNDGNEIIGSNNQLELENGTKPSSDFQDRNLKYDSLRCLSYVVCGYFLVAHIVGSVLVYCYMSLYPFPRQTLKTKRIKRPTFSVFSVVSTFANCGFIPTNENMIIFKQDSVLLLLLISQILLGNTLYPPCLRFTIWILEKITKRREFSYLLKNSREIGYDHLLCGLHSTLLALTVLGFILVQMAVFCALEWGSEAMIGMSLYQKLVASLFQVVNSRHAGESVFDLSKISSAVLVLFVVMM